MPIDHADTNPLAVDCGHSSLQIRFSDGPDRVGETILAALATSSILHLRPVDSTADRLAFWADVARAVGTIDLRHESSDTHLRFESVWWDVQYDPAHPNTYRHSKTRQPLHTDSAFHDDPSDATMFVCEAPARAGGACTFLDARRLVAVMEAEAPDLLAAVLRTPLLFKRGDNPGNLTPIIRLEADAPRVNWNYYRVAPDQPEATNQVKERFHEFLERRFVATGDLLRLTLRAWEAVIFKDQRVLHGREAFEATERGDRVLQTLCLKLPASVA